MMRNNKIELGIIDDILNEYPDTTDIVYSNGSFKLSTKDNQFTYKMKENSKGTELDVINIINNWAQFENKIFDKKQPIFNSYYNNIRISAIHDSLSPIGTTMALRIIKRNKKLGV